MSTLGHSRRFRHVRGMSGQEAISDMAVLVTTGPLDFLGKASIAVGVPAEITGLGW